MDPVLAAKKLEYEEKKARAKALKLRLTCTICGARPKILLNCPCGTTQYCSTACQRIDWRDRGHRKACKKIRDERAAEAARAEAPTPPEAVFYGPAPRSQADEIRARIAAEHEAARLRREANPEPEPESERFGRRCPICYEDWDVNENPWFRACCARTVCGACNSKIAAEEPCPLCRAPPARTASEMLARLRRHVENEVPEAIKQLGEAYQRPDLGLVKCSSKKAAKLYKRAAELGNAEAMCNLGALYIRGDGVKMDKKKGLQLYRMAADLGNANAQYNVALSSQDDEDVVKYYRLAADQGLTDAEHNLGERYVIGRGVTQDLEEAKRWFGRAAAKGDILSVDALERLSAWEREDAATGVET